MKKAHLRICFFFIILFSIPSLPAQNVTHGPIVGGVTSSHAVFVIRTDSHALIQIELSTSSSFDDPIFTETIETNKYLDYFGKVHTSGLEGYTLYFYRAMIDGIPATLHPFGSFHTFPEEGVVTTFMFQFGSCQQAGKDPLSNIGHLFPLMALERPDFFIHQGDWGYPDTTEIYFALDTMMIAKTYRARYDSTYPMIQLLKTTPVAFTYDDHDMVANNSDKTFPGIINSINMYQQMFPGYALPHPDLGIWHKFVYGNADIFMVDNRSQRDPNHEGFMHWGSDSMIFNPQIPHRILGTDQMIWLVDELKNSNATWKFISSGTPFNPAWRIAIEMSVLFQKIIEGVNVPGMGFVTPSTIAAELADKWAGFPEDIVQLIQTIKQNHIENVIFLSGDIHTSGVDDGQNAIFPEILSSGLDRTNGAVLPLFETFGIQIWNKGGHIGGLPDSLYRSNFGRVSVFGSDSVVLEAVHEDGKTVLGKHTVLSGFLPKDAGVVVAPQSMNFGSVKMGQSNTLTAIFLSTSYDTLRVSDIQITGSQCFSVDTSVFKIPGCQKREINIFFTPDTAYTHEADIQFSTNDPDRPIVTISVQGYGTGTSDILKDDILFNPSIAHQNFPNPFNPRTTIEFTIPRNEMVTLKICNLLGETLEILALDRLKAGKHDYDWDAKEFNSGVYFYQLYVGDKIKTGKMLLIK